MQLLFQKYFLSTSVTLNKSLKKFFVHQRIGIIQLVLLNVVWKQNVIFLVDLTLFWRKIFILQEIQEGFEHFQQSFFVAASSSEMTRNAFRKKKKTFKTIINARHKPHCSQSKSYCQCETHGHFHISWGSNPSRTDQLPLRLSQRWQQQATKKEEPCDLHFPKCGEISCGANECQGTSFPSSESDDALHK